MLTLTNCPTVPFTQDALYQRHVMGLAADHAIEALRPRLGPDPQSTLSWARDQWEQLPWAIFALNFERIVQAEDSAQTINYLLDRAAGVALAGKPEYLTELGRMVELLCKEAHRQLEGYRAFEKAMAEWALAKKQARQARTTFSQPMPKCPYWPADIYRHFGVPLRYAAQLKYDRAARLLRDIQLEATLPPDEMEHPGWVDSYTGAVTEKEERVNVQKQTFRDWAEESEFIQDQNLDWTIDDYVNFQNAQSGGFNADRDEEEAVTDETDTIDKDFGFKSDYSLTSGAAELEVLLRDEIEALTMKVRTAWEIYQLACDTQGQAIAETRRSVLESKESNQLLEMFQRQARVFLPQDIASVALRFQNALCWDKAQFNTIRVGANNIGLMDWVNLMGDDYLEQFQDAAPTWRDPTDAELDQFDALTLNQQVLEHAPRFLGDVWENAFEEKHDVWRAFEAFWEAARKWGGQIHPISKRRLVVNHPCFVMGMLQAAAAGTTTENGQVAAGWEMFRSQVCPEGNKAYHDAIARKAPHAEAMKAFWAIFNKKFPIQARILKPQRDGLLLEGGRKVDWHVAALKLRANELEIDPSLRERLIKALSEAGTGGDFLAQLKA